MDVNSDINGDNSQNISTDRISCKYGSMCYRTNPSHRVDEAHPGDSDYIVPQIPTSPASAPECQYGSKCFRLNPEHIQNYHHPLYTNAQENLRKHREGTLYTDDSASSDSDVDPFVGDSGDSDYVPSEDSG